MSKPNKAKKTTAQIIELMEAEHHVGKKLASMVKLKGQALDANRDATEKLLGIIAILLAPMQEIGIGGNAKTAEQSFKDSAETISKLAGTKKGKNSEKRILPVKTVSEYLTTVAGMLGKHSTDADRTSNDPKRDAHLIGKPYPQWSNRKTFKKALGTSPSPGHVRNVLKVFELKSFSAIQAFVTETPKPGKLEKLAKALAELSTEELATVEGLAEGMREQIKIDADKNAPDVNPDAEDFSPSSPLLTGTDD